MARIRIVEVEGTPEELKGIDIQGLLGKDPPPIAVDQVPRSELRTDLDGDLVGFVGRSAPVGHRQLVLDLLKRTSVWEGVLLVMGGTHSDGSPRYVRVHRTPQTFGAFMYVLPRNGRVTFRLDLNDMPHVRHARARQVNSANVYRTELRLTSPNALEEAVLLARAAYERANASFHTA
jgi:hypothetical protein